MTQYNSLNVKLSNSNINMQIFVKLLLKIHQLILNYQKLSYQK